MKCKDCSAGHKLTCLDCGKPIIVCTSESPEIIAIKYWEDEDGCQGIDEK